MSLLFICKLGIYSNLTHILWERDERKGAFFILKKPIPFRHKQRSAYAIWV